MVTDIKKGDRIYVNCLLWEGWGTVREIFSNELLPVSVELDYGDNEGHRFKRVAFDNIELKKEDNGSE